MLGPMDHGMCVSIYFAGLENVSLEIAYSEIPIDPQSWIDPEVVSLLNISDSELESFISPPDYSDRSGKVKQPTSESDSGPHMSHYPEGAYAQVISTTDEVVWNMVDNTPTRLKEVSK